MVVDLALGLSAAGVDVEVAVVNSHRDRLAPTLDDHGITLHRLDGTDTIGLRSGATPRRPRHRRPLRRRTRPWSVTRCGRSHRDQGTPDDHHLPHPLGVVAPPDADRVARHRCTRRGEHRRVGRRGRVAARSSPSTRHRDPPRDRPRPDFSGDRCRRRPAWPKHRTERLSSRTERRRRHGHGGHHRRDGGEPPRCEELPEPAARRAGGAASPAPRSGS